MKITRYKENWIYMLFAYIISLVFVVGSIYFIFRSGFGTSYYNEFVHTDVFLFMCFSSIAEYIATNHDVKTTDDLVKSFKNDFSDIDRIYNMVSEGLLIKSKLFSICFISQLIMILLSSIYSFIVLFIMKNYSIKCILATICNSIFMAITIAFIRRIMKTISILNDIINDCLEDKENED